MKAQKQSKPWYKKWWVIAIFVIFVAPTILAILLAIPEAAKEVKKQDSQATKATSEQEQSNVPSYEIKIVGNTYADPTSRRLTFTVKNTGDKESNPACNVTVQNEAGTYRGTDYVTWNTPLEPGDTKYFEGLIVVTNEGAAYATKSNVSCVERQY